MCKYIFNYPERLHTFEHINIHANTHIYTYSLYVVFTSAYLKIKTIKPSVIALKVRGLVNLYILVFLPE